MRIIKRVQASRFRLCTD